MKATETTTGEKMEEGSLKKLLKPRYSDDNIVRTTFTVSPTAQGK